MRAADRRESGRDELELGYLDRELIGRISNRIINEVRGINRVVLDVSSKPSATIE